MATLRNVLLSQNAEFDFEMPEITPYTLKAIRNWYDNSSVIGRKGTYIWENDLDEIVNGIFLAELAYANSLSQTPSVNNSSTGNSGGNTTKGNGETKILYRGDKASVTPDKVFGNGFTPKGTHSDALLHTKSNATAGNFISTSSDKGIATDFEGKNGYVYVIETNNYIDINSTYGTYAIFPEQMEFSVPGGINPSEIIGAYKKQGGVIVGDLIPNPNYRGQ